MALFMVPGSDSTIIREIVGIDNTGEPMGHADKTQSVISFNSSTRVFTIQPSASSFDVWCKGVKYTYSTSKTITIPNTTGLYYIYFDATGVLGYSTTYFVWESQVPTAYVYWNAANSQAVYFGDERHGIVLDWQTHEYLHRTRGASLAGGFDILNYTTTGDGSANTHAQIGLNDGTFFDEDLQVDITHSATPVANTWQQALRTYASIPVVYRNNTSWIRDTATAYPFKQGAARPVYNVLSAGNWSTTDVDVNKYLSVFIVATHNLNNPIIAIIGQKQHVNINDAKAETWNSLDLTGFPSLEFRTLYQLVYQCGAFGNSVGARLRDAVDLRYQAIGLAPSGGVGSIDALTDVDTSTISPANGQALAWNGTNWVPATVSSSQGDLWILSW